MTEVTWNKASIQSLVVTNDRAAVKALVTIYQHQTESEKCAHTTKEHNNVGFTATDAEILTSFATQYLKRGFLSEKQMALLKKRITKYWRQLLDAAKAKGATVSYTVPKSKSKESV